MRTAALSTALALTAAASAQNTVPTVGPFNLELIEAGEPIVEPIPDSARKIWATQGGSWTLAAWINPAERIAQKQQILSLRSADERDLITLAIDARGLEVGAGGASVRGNTSLPSHHWSSVIIVAGGGRLKLYIDGHLKAQGSRAASLGAATTLEIAPRVDDVSFAGRIAGLRLVGSNISPAAVHKLAADAPAESLIAFTPNSPSWPVQTKQQLGQVTPQPADTLPVSRGGCSPAAAKVAPTLPTLAPVAPGRWTVNGWQLAAAPSVSADGAALSRPGNPAGKWYAATVPGTVLTTLVDRGVYPDPSFGLNNMAIPESLSRQSYWYRTQFRVPVGAPEDRLFLDFKGINYAGEIWINGTHVGDTRGAFIRGQFDITDYVHPGDKAVVAVKVAPPPHPGIAEEESLTAGAGENGGMLVLDGPTFVASEGWDWIPSIRDRETGMWQGVSLEQSGAVRLGDAQIVTTLPRRDNSVADVSVAVPVENLADRSVATLVRAKFDDVDVSQTVTLAPHENRTVTFAPVAYPQLAVKHPLLWWPNGYGRPDLHDMAITASIGNAVSDSRKTRFGIREVSYEMSLVDHQGALRRLEVDPSRAIGTQIVDATHEKIRQVRGGWAASLAKGAEGSAAIRDISGDDGLSPYLVIRVNGVRIAARGGNWGMDDLMKRVGRDRLEPYFRLHREAHLNIIRNWVGQNTEETFYDLADEYGLMVLNDFWESTQNYNQQADDTALFMTNAHDVVNRFRNHPSIIAWIGRNEGVPQPTLNSALQNLITSDDGTRLYLSSSNRINLAGSGPYNWREPEEYFTQYAPGFAVEVGTPSFPTLESWKRTMPAADLWPISDTWAYHDWHQDRGGSVDTYMQAMKTRFGAPTSLTDFAAKAQMLQYDSYRAIFEGFNAKLWKETSGRMLWMTQPAWPSSAWNIFSSDYDTQASYYAVKKASEPVHVQMNLPDHRIVLVNNTEAAIPALKVHLTIETLSGYVLDDRSITVDAAAASVTPVSEIDPAILRSAPVSLVRLEAIDAQGGMLSQNTYWQSTRLEDLKALTTLPSVALTIHASETSAARERQIQVMLANPTSTPAIETKLTLFDAKGVQVLPAYFSDNYVTLLPGEQRTITVRVPASAPSGPIDVAVRGWNVEHAVVADGRVN